MFRRPSILAALTVVCFGQPRCMQDTYNFGRVLSPLLLRTFVEQFGRSPLAAMAMIDLRIVLNLAGELEGIVRGLLK